MNHTYNLVWSAVRGAFIVTHEHAKSKGKPSSTRKGLATALMVSLLAGSGLAGNTWAAPPSAPPANTLPTGGSIVGGAANGSIATSGNAMTVTQNPQRMIANWDTFSIGSAASVNFVQPTGGVALNRVTGTAPSEIFGKLSANGSVFLLNPNGVLFGKTAQVDVGSLAATTMGLGDADFMAGRYAFTSSSRTSNGASVLNQGSITAAGSSNGGAYVALLSPEVRNEGVITARLGSVVLGAADAVTLSVDGSGLHYAVDKGAVKALVDNKGLVQADGGQVLLSARSANDLATAVINHSGTIEAKGMVAKGGKIILEADHITLASGSTLDASGATGGGTVLVGGGWQGSGDPYQATSVTMEQGAKIDVSASKVGAGGTAVLWSDVHKDGGVTKVDGDILAKGGAEIGDGGKVETSGHTLKIGDNARVSTQSTQGNSGQWLLDPTDFTIAATGGDMTGAALTAALTSNHITITTTPSCVITGGATACTGYTQTSAGANGDININDAVSWSANTLTLSARRFINLNGTVTVSNSGGLDATVNGMGMGPASWWNGAYLKATQSGSAFAGKIDWSGSGTLAIRVADGYGAFYSQQTYSTSGDGASVGKIITSAAELVAIPNSTSNKYLLGADITLTGTWTPKTAFAGSLNGLGHMISGLDTGGAAGGLFSTIDGASVSNLGIVNYTIGGGVNGGGGFATLVGGISSGTNYIVNVFNGVGDIVNTGDNANIIGGIVASIGSTATVNMSDVVNRANIHSQVGSGKVINSVGGIVGYVTGSLYLTNSSNSGEIIAGDPDNKTTTTLGSSVGGLVGVLTSGSYNYYSYLTNTGNVYGKDSVGGIVGDAWSANSVQQLGFDRFENRGNISGTGTAIGGLVGKMGSNSNSLSMYYGANKGAVTKPLDGGTANIGGLIGEISSTKVGGSLELYYSYNSGDVSVTGAPNSSYLGGLVGYAYVNGSVRNYYDYNVGSTSNGGYVGGLYGMAQLSTSGGTSAWLSFKEVYSAGAMNCGYNCGAYTGRADIPNGYVVGFNDSSWYKISNSGGGGISYFGSYPSAPTTSGTTTGGVATAANLADVTALNFGGSWTQNNGINNGYVYLTSNVPTTPLTITVNALSKTYGDTSNPTLSGQYSLTGCTGCITLDWGSYLTSATAAGSYSYSTANLLGLTYVSGSASSYSLTWGATNFTVNPRTVTLTGSKTYDGTATSAGATLTVSNTVNAGNGGDVTVTNGGTAAIASRNVGSRALSDMAGLSLSNNNYTLTGASGSVTVNARPITLSTSNVVKTYDGTTSASGTATLTSGSLGAGDSVSGGSFAFSSKDYGAGNKTVTVSDSNSGNNYTVSYASNTTSTINKKSLTMGGLSSTDKTYDGTTSATVSGSAALQAFEATGSGNTADGKAYTGDTVSLTGTAVGTFNSKEVASANTVSFSGISLTGAQATNYTLTAHAIDTTPRITAKALTMSGLSSANKVYDGNTTATVSGSASFGTETVGSGTTSDGKAYTLDTVSLTGTAAGAFNFKDVATATTVSYSGLSLTGANASNYSLTSHASGSYSITAKTVSLSANKTYDGNFSLGTVTVTTGVAGEALSYSAATAHSKDVGAGNYVDAISLSSGTGDVANYQLPSVTAASGDNAVTINAKALTLTGSKTYDGATSLTDFVTLGGFVGTETLNVTSATASNAHVAGNGSNFVSAITLANGSNGGVPGNYSLPAYSYHATNNAVTINTATLTPTITNTGVTKVYDGALTSSFTPTYSYVGLASGDTTATLSSTGKNYNTKDAATASQITVSGLAITGITGGNSSAASDYVLDATSKTVAATITPKTLTVSGLAADPKTYNALTDVTISNWGSVTPGVNTETLVLNHGTASFADKTKANGKTVTAIGYSLANASDASGGLAGNYQLSSTSSTTTANITAKTITLAGSTGVTKTYSGTTAMPVGSNGYGSLVGVESGDTVTISGAPVYDSVNQGARTINQNTVAIAGTDASNYTLSWSDGSGTINPAPLTVRANNDANFVTLASTGVAAYNGVSYSGFVNGETIAVLGGAPTITRSGSGPDGNTGGGNTLAGTYTNALVPSGVTANNGNYSISYAPGTYTIVPAGQLLVTVQNDAFTYGTAPSYTVTSAKYLAGDNTTIATLTTASPPGTSFTYTDGASGTASFTLGPIGPQTSTNGALKAGSYSISASNITETSNNFSNNLVVVGALTVDPKGLTATATGLTKVYDGTTAMNNVSLTAKTLTISGLTAANKTYDGSTAATFSTAGASYIGLVSGDSVTVSATGTFSDKNVGSGKTVTLVNSYGGGDVGNYSISGQATTTASITPKTISMTGASAQDKTFDGTTSATVSMGSLVGLVGGESLGVSGQGGFNDPNIGIGKTVSIRLALSDGATGSAGNYSIGDATASANINAVPTAVPPPPPSVPTAPPAPPEVPTPAPAQVPPGSEGVPLPLSGDPAGSPGTPLTGVPGGAGGLPTDPAGGTGIGGGTPTDPNGSTGAGGGATGAGGGGAGGGTAGSGSGTGTGTGGAGGDPVPVTLSAGPEISLSASGGQAGGQSGADAAGGSGRSTSGDVGGRDSTGFVSVRSFGATTVPAGSLFSFTLPKDTFKHADPKATVVLEARMADGKPLPAWLSFDPGTGRFMGRAPEGVKQMEVLVVARDNTGSEASTKVALQFV